MTNTEQIAAMAERIEKLEGALRKIRKPITVCGPADVVSACQDLHELICDLIDQALLSSGDQG